MIHFTCASCGRRIQVPETAAGKQGKCPACAAVMQVPAAALPEPLAPLPAGGRQPPPLPAPLPPRVAPPLLAAASLDGELPPAAGALPLPRAGDGRHAAVAFDCLIDALARALSPWKLGLFLAGGLLLWGVFWCLGKVAPTKDPGLAVAILWVLLHVVLAVGLLGILAGTVARMTHREGRGQREGLLDTLVFCGRRSLDFAAGTVIVVLGVALLCYVVNLLIGQLRAQGTFGDTLTSLLFLPQLAFNMLGVFLLLVAVLVPCVIAVEDVGAMRALARIFTSFGRRVHLLVVQVAVTYFLGGVLTAILGLVLLCGLLPTVATNPPRDMPEFASQRIGEFLYSVYRSQPLMGNVSRLTSRQGRDADPDELAESFQRSFLAPREEAVRPHYGGAARLRELESQQSPPTSGPQWPRWLTLLLCYAVVVVYPVVFWVCSFTRFYESASPAGQESDSISGGR